MADRRALIVAFDNSDKAFFAKNLDRNAYIRLPHQGEAHGEFWQLGDHNRARRRILLWRIPRDNPYFDAEKQPLLKIPFLAYSDETIEDRDDVLLPIIAQIMSEQVAVHGGQHG